ncbi:hypothetical protein YB2330_004482 [Saitoella coloradoensis]
MGSGSARKQRRQREQEGKDITTLKDLTGAQCLATVHIPCEPVSLNIAPGHQPYGHIRPDIAVQGSRESSIYKIGANSHATIHRKHQSQITTKYNASTTPEMDPQTPLPHNTPSHLSTSTPAPTSSTTAPHPPLSPLESALLSEYTSLSQNLTQLNTTIASLANTPTAQILDELRSLERKTGLVFTLFKASVYAIVMQNEEMAGAEGEGDGEESRVLGEM